ncbi:MAG TPA: hypothetical protein VH054_26270 [Polyangiaceae bacterium]|jgi:hypothetical protein|nr:hypothetical protein [Polyangiaceae bacterium]
MMRAYVLLVVLAACSTDTFTGADASSDEGGGGGDGGVDAAPACVQSFCANANATTCDDFDTNAQGWANDTTNSPSFTIGTAQLHATSCPNALQVVMTAMTTSPAGTEPHGYVITDLQKPNDVTVAFDAFLPDIPSADAGFVDGMVFFALRGTLDGSWAVRLERSADTYWYLRLHQGTGVQSVPVTNILTGALNHMTLTVHNAQDLTGSASLAYQTTQNTSPQTVQLTKVQTLPNSELQSTSFAIGAGALSAISQPYTFFYDSITIDAN